ncbi:methyl-accepting chemotaxis protein [Hydrogenophaga sp.]|jgi:twitching motility protein PilJ|uniref:methyl-accepting chemotaxis protein n=1 Tax=Hydrogenophaga sp. TaxID=1904254 RepID=UPI002718912D|nr:methyl-accepting chemotaxis protein [Hydrogenophaga sp.]MDO9252420.1 methyl-accepting chemotaxis protein [Hydrogenophaga sp.]MDP2406802.1 methyl-accepting chemotaxis protein [Hydrogenophaga sp.]MDP3344245.1 methyl-accepting chemotaxis protein [Hydrogenophaga sp.]MDP3887262.1 methyl-accepting chemotaxis protein [Hydrogenophaga sp.]MDZ4175933.1 methyl-accepting chemotaxis protein [Hydrogenophaga sp.]
MAMLDRFQGLFRKQGADEPDLSHVADQEMAELAAARLAPDRSDDLAENRLAPGDDDVSSGAGLVSLPLLGSKTAEQHRRNLGTLLVFALVLLVAVVFFVLSQTEKISQQVAASGQALMQSQRLAKSVSQALVGSPAAFPEVRESSDVLSRNMRGFKEGDSELSIDALGAAYTDQLTELTPRIDAAMSNASTVLAQQSILTQVGDSLRSINRQSSDLLEIAETISALKLERNAPAADISAAGQLVMLTQRIGKSANEFLTLEGVSPEAVFLLGKDLNTFKEIAEALLNGSDELRLKATTDPQIRERLEALLKLYDQTRTEAAAILGNLQGLASAREAQASIVADSEPLRIGLQKLQSDLSARAGLGGRELAALLASALFALLCGAGLAFVQLQESRQRQLMAENQRLTAESQEQDAKRVNDANQAAILRLMNELQTVAEGDLTQEATVTEDITGAIADSVNYTVEELRSLVGNVQATATRVAQTTSAVESTSTELLAASNEQLREIRETGQSVVDMAQRINQVSGQAQESASVARVSLQAAEQGLQAVQDAIGGMNAIRDQIQETSKRIKRLGESSQEIGEITELISDITEQTNVLALNAAIQAASAGEAGRGFSVVAEEVQRLAERSADATRQIAALVKAIQTDTQDAVAAMERSTQGVVEGAKLSDNAGTALSEIDRVSRRLAELIEQISDAASREAESANEVAGNIQHIFAVTEQTGEGTRSTAQQVRELSAMAEELRQSVSRFKIA